MQERFAAITGSPAPMPGLDYTEEKAADPNFQLFADAKDAAASAGIDRLPKGLETEFNEVAKIVFREAQRMIIEGPPPRRPPRTSRRTSWRSPTEPACRSGAENPRRSPRWEPTMSDLTTSPGRAKPASSGRSWMIDFSSPRHQAKFGYLLLAPAVILIALIIIYPMILSIDLASRT